MQRAGSVLRGGEFGSAPISDSVVLTADERHRRRLVLTGESGVQFLLDLPQAVALRDGDGLVLDDGSVIQVVGKPEPVLDVTAKNGPELARLAWHLGNRHTEVQILGTTLRIRRDHVLEKMLRHLGAEVTAREAAFDPESGAYGQAIGQLAPHAQQPHTHIHEHADHSHSHSHAHEHDHAQDEAHSPARKR